MCTIVLPAWICLCTIYMPGVCGGQKKVLDFLELELRTVVGAGNKTWVPCKFSLKCWAISPVHGFFWRWNLWHYVNSGLILCWMLWELGQGRRNGADLYHISLLRSMVQLCQPLNSFCFYVGIDKWIEHFCVLSKNSRGFFFFCLKAVQQKENGCESRKADSARLCGNVNKASPYSRGYLNPWAPVTDDVEEGLGGVALLQEVRHWGWA